MGVRPNIFSAGDLNSLVACNNQGLVAMSAQFLLLVCVTCSLEKRVAFCESQPTHPLGGILTDSFDSRSPCLVFACDRAHNLWASIPTPQPISSGTLQKNGESGIWLKICKIICDSRNWDSTLPITPDHSRFFPSKNYRQKSGEIGSQFFLRIPDRQLTFPIIPDFSRISRALKLDRVWRGFSGRLFRPAMSCHRFCVGRRHATPMHCYWQWQRWTLLLHLLKLQWGS